MMNQFPSPVVDLPGPVFPLAHHPPSEALWEERRESEGIVVGGDYAVQLRLLPAYSSVFCETLPYHPAIGLIAMFAAPLVTVEFAPHRVFLVPCLGLVFFAPVVLMPLRRKGGKSDA